MIEVMIPTLTIDGFIKHPPVILNKIFEYFQLVDSDSSVAYFGEVYSLDKIIQNNINDMEGLKNEIESSLGNIMSRYFSEYEVDVSVDKLNGEKTVYKIKIDLTANIGSGVYTLSKNYLTNNNTMNLNYLTTGSI